MSSIKLIAIVSIFIIGGLAIYIKSAENHGSHWHFSATNWTFNIYTLTYKVLILIGIKKREQTCSLKLELMDDIFRRLVKPDYTNHTLNSAASLLTQTRQGRKGFLKLTLPPIWDKKNNIIQYDTIENTKVLWLNKHKISNGVIISLHGGAYISGSCDSCLPYLLPLTKYTNMSGLSINYSLSPEVILPYQINEVFNIYKHLLNNMNVNNKDIIIIGDSAGASLLLLLIQKLIKDKTYNNKLPLCGITMSSWDVPSHGNSYKSNRDTDSLMDDKTGQVWGHFTVANIDINGQILEKDSDKFDKNMNDNEEASYLHKNNLWTFKQFPPLFLSVSEWECVLDDSVRIKNEMDKYINENGSECILHVTKGTGIHVLEDFHAHGIIEAEKLLQTEAQWILKHYKTG